jgi:hypothetical protein
VSFIVLMRNPESKALLPLTTSDNPEAVAEFESQSEAREQADTCMAAIAWGFQVIDLEEGEVYDG